MTVAPSLGDAAGVNSGAYRAPRSEGEADEHRLSEAVEDAFRRFRAQDVSNVALGVDTTNPTGVTRLYEKAGMEITREFAFDEKELRPGEKAPVEDE